MAKPKSDGTYPTRVPSRSASSLFGFSGRVPAPLRGLGDLAAACALIAFTLPLMAIVAIAIKFDSPGPVLAREQCVGIGGRRFVFRTTLHAAEDADLAWHRAPQTRLGPYLRYTHIDALPQLFNVRRAEMSMIDSVAFSPSFLD